MQIITRKYKVSGIFISMLIMLLVCCAKPRNNFVYVPTRSGPEIEFYSLENSKKDFGSFASFYDEKHLNNNGAYVYRYIDRVPPLLIYVDQNSDSAYVWRWISTIQYMKGKNRCMKKAYVPNEVKRVLFDTSSTFTISVRAKLDEHNYERPCYYSRIYRGEDRKGFSYCITKESDFKKTSSSEAQYKRYLVIEDYINSEILANATGMCEFGE